MKGMEFMKEKVLKAILVPILIMLLTMFDFLILGQGISIAIEETGENATNVKNIEFGVSLNQTEEEIKISSEPSLILDIDVKDRGVFNDGKIKIENANFTIQKDKVQNSYVKNINLETNEIELNSIIYSNHIKLEIPIQFKTKEEIEEDYFQREITILLSGNYKDETEEKVNARKKLKMNWTEEAEIVFNQEIKKFRKIENVGILLQQEIKTEVIENKLPRESENLLVEVPILEEQQPQKIYVLKNGSKMSEEEIEFNKETNVLEIKSEKSLLWGRQQNVYSIIYLYDSAIEVKETTVALNTLVNTKLFTKEAIQKQETIEILIQEMGNLVSIQKETSAELYKGYLLARAEQETPFTEKNTLQISNVEAVNQIEIEKASEEFTDDVNLFDISQDITYKSTQVNKEELERILGNDGQITITDEAGVVLGQINQDNLTIDYEAEVKNIKLTTTKPIAEGELTITHTREIQSTQAYNKDQLKTFTKVITRTKAISNQSEEIAEAEILLKDTRTEAKLEISNQNLSTLQKNENVQFLITLKSDSWEYDLYKNPFVKITLPTELSVEIKNVTQLNGQEELNIVNPIFYENEAKEKIIEMQLEGEQTRFENSINEGIQISITADITIDKTVPSKNSEITMYCTNENRPSEEYRGVVPIQLNSKYGVLTVNKLLGYNSNEDSIENIDDKIKEATLDTNAEAKEAMQEIAIVNNYENEITDVVVMGKIPNKGQEEVNGETLQATFEMNLAQAVQTEGNIQVYYAENPNEEKDSEAWTNTPEDFTKVRAFKLQLEDNTMQPQEVLKISYPLTIQENLEENEESYTNLEVNYNYLGDNVETNSTFSFKTAKQEGQEEVVTRTETAKLTMEVQGVTEGKILTEGQEVYEGQGITYEMTITNHSQETLNQVKIKATNTNAIYYDEILGRYQSGEGEVDEPTTRILENPDLTEKEMTIEEIKPGEKKKIRYQISVKEVEGDEQTTTGTIEIVGENLEPFTITTPSCIIKQADLKVKLESFYQEEIDVLSRQTYPIVFHIENISKAKIKDTIIELPLPEGLTFSTEGIYIEQDSKYEFVEYKDKVLRLKVSSIEVGETISIQVGLLVEDMPYEQLTADTSLYFRAIAQNKIYVSNYIYKTVYQSETLIQAKQTSDIQRDTIKDKEDLTFTFEIENQGNIEKNLYFSDKVPTGLVVQEAYLLEGENKTNLSATANSVSARIEIAAKQKVIIKIHTKVDAEIIYQSTVTNYAEITGGTVNIKTNEITYKVEGKKQQQQEKPTEKAKQAISGLVWVDQNQNGLKDTTEPRLANIPVLLLEEITGKVVLRATTNENGIYEFKELNEGNYLVVFQYDATKYTITEYQKEGIGQENNSDVITKMISLDGQEKQVAITKTLNLKSTDLLNIDAGFVEKEKFDLKLDKYIDKIIIQNNKGTVVKQYGKEKLAKIELDSKQIQNSTIIIQYKIEVTNEGKISGYANDIVDYKPADLSFSSEMNKNWYQSANGELHSNELSNQIIDPTETKTVTLTLIKKMTSNNTGTTINVAEIAKASNSLALQDIDSTPGNKVQGEDDMSTAEVIISIRTGGIIMYFSLAIVIMMIIGGGTYWINKKILKTEEKKMEKEF